MKKLLPLALIIILCLSCNKDPFQSATLQTFFFNNPPTTDANGNCFAPLCESTIPFELVISLDDDRVIYEDIIISDLPNELNIELPKKENYHFAIFATGEIGRLQQLGKTSFSSFELLRQPEQLKLGNDGYTEGSISMTFVYE